MKILAISGSLRAASANSAIVRATLQLAPTGMKITIYEGIGDLPHFNPELDNENPPGPVKDWRERIQWADGMLICTPEYVFGMPGTLKNALDWLVSTVVLEGKPMVTISASPLYGGGDKAHASLLLTVKTMSAKIPEGGTLTVPDVKNKIDAQGTITDAETIDSLRALLETLAATIANVES